MSKKRPAWPKKIICWQENRTMYFSVVFTWHLKSVRERILEGYLGIKKYIVGGPAIKLLPDYLEDIAQVQDSLLNSYPLERHNKQATFTTRGCPNSCSYCAVPKTEGNLIELEKWPIRPIICDNNLLAATRKHFDKVIDALKNLSWCDFNQGLDARLFDPYIASRMAELKNPKIRFACDTQKSKSIVAEAVKIARKAGLENFGIYVLIGYKDSPEEALDRLRFVRSLDIWPNPMRFQPLDTMEKNSYVASGWTNKLLFKYMQYWGRLRIYEHIPFEEFDRSKHYKRIDRETRQLTMRI